MQINIQKIIYLNCGERYEVMINHYSYTHNLSSCEIKAELSKVKLKLNYVLMQTLPFVPRNFDGC